MIDQTPILYIDNSFTFGGAINSLSHFLRAIDKDKFVPIIVTGQPPDEIKQNFTCFFYHYKPKLPWVNNHIYRKLLTFSIFQNKYFLKMLNFLRFIYWLVLITIPESLKYYRIGRKHNVSLIHLNNILGSQLAGIIASKLLRIPCVAHLRDFEMVHPITIFYAKLIDHHIAISNAIYRNLIELNVSNNNITLVMDAIDLCKFHDNVDYKYLIEEYQLTSKRPLFGIFGRVVDWKGIEVFIHATSLVVEKLPNALAFIVGNCSDGEEHFMDEMKQLVYHLNLSENIIFTGYRTDIPAFMKMMEVVVHASKTPEPFGMVLIEAMAMNKPIIATKAGGPLDIVLDGETGLLVEMGNYVALAEAIISLLIDPELQNKFGKSGRKRVENFFSSTIHADQIESIYTKLLKSSLTRAS